MGRRWDELAAIVRRRRGETKLLFASCAICSRCWPSAAFPPRRRWWTPLRTMPARGSGPVGGGAPGRAAFGAGAARACAVDADSGARAGQAGAAAAAARRAATRSVMSGRGPSHARRPRLGRRGPGRHPVGPAGAARPGPVRRDAGRGPRESGEGAAAGAAFAAPAAAMPCGTEGTPSPCRRARADRRGARPGRGVWRPAAARRRTGRPTGPHRPFADGDDRPVLTVVASQARLRKAAAVPAGMGLAPASKAACEKPFCMVSSQSWLRAAFPCRRRCPAA